jgi:hypothetical protein
MDIHNVTQFYNFLARTGLVDHIPNGRLLMSCIDEYKYKCGCERDKNKTAVYNRCKSLYEDMVRNLNNVTITLIFQRIPDLSVAFRQEGNQHLRTIVR